MLKMMKYSLIGILAFTIFTAVIAGFDYKIYTKQICDDLRKAFRSVPAPIIIKVDNGNNYYCADEFCISPEFSFTIGFDYFDNNRYNGCIEEIYNEINTNHSR